MPKNKTVKKVKAWVVCDGSDVPVVFGSMNEKSEKSIYFIYQNEKEAKRQWGGFGIYPATIIYSPKPNKRIKK